MKLDMNEKVECPSGVQASYKDNILTIKGPKGEISRSLVAPLISIGVEDNSVFFSAKSATKREKRMIHTFRSHARNMVKGVQEPYVYELKICAGHFPMNVSLSGNKLLIKNFLGEKKPRVMTVKDGAKVEIKGTDIIVKSINKEIAGNVASDIELLTAVTGRDRRIFQDGIYITVKAGRKVSD